LLARGNVVAQRSVNCLSRDHLHNQAMRRVYEIPAPGEVFDWNVFYLGVLCKRDHDWGGGKTIRIIGKKYCPLCARIDAIDRQGKRRVADPERERALAAERQRRHRALHGKPSSSKKGLPYGLLKAHGLNNRHGPRVAALLNNGLTIEQAIEQIKIDSVLKITGRSPSVLQLVRQAQRDYWRDHPDERRAFISKQGAWQYAWRYKVDSAFRLHECQRNSERKARNRNNHTVRLRPKQITARFAQFDNRCVYCGSTERLVIDHFISRAKGGPHNLGNLVPACHRCNTSKTDNDPEQWYKAQPFFTKRKWQAILKALGKGKAGVHQMPLL